MIDKTVFKDKKAVYYTLGCKLNFSETATIERQLQEACIRTAKRGEVADICVVCGGIAMIVYVLFFYDKLEGTDGNRPSDC